MLRIVHPLRSFAFGLLALLPFPAQADGPSSAGSSAPEVPAAVTAKPYPTGVQCYFVPQMHSTGFSVIDDQHVTIDGFGRAKYLLTLNSRCSQLNWEIAIGLERHGSDLCTGDALLVGHQHCVIRYIEEVATAKEALAIVAARNEAEAQTRKAKGH
jgi:hypothetical protein